MCSELLAASCDELHFEAWWNLEFQFLLQLLANLKNLDVLLVNAFMRNGCVMGSQIVRMIQMNKTVVSRPIVYNKLILDNVHMKMKVEFPKIELCYVEIVGFIQYI
jgi:hypothetical protein